MDSSNLTAFLVITTLISSLFIAWLALIAVSRILYRRSRGFPLISRTVHAVHYRSAKTARKAASERREKLQGFLNEYRDRTVVGQEFMELPDWWNLPLGQIRRQFTGEEAEGYWHTARLYLQLNRDQDLLIERVIDLLDYMARAGKIEPWEFPTTVRLEQLPGRFELKGKFPWRVVVTTSHPNVISALLNQKGIAEWLGIGVDCERIKARHRRKDHVHGSTPSEPTTPSVATRGRCKEGSDGKEGVIGGLVSVKNAEQTLDTYRLTCRHVVSSTCPVVDWPEPPIRPPAQEFTQNSPDVAFLSADLECFSDSPSTQTVVTTFNQDEIDLAVFHETQFRKAPLRDNKLGIVSSGEVKAIKLEGHMYRGPHVAINPYFYQRFLVVRPFFSRSFSEEGDSGSWVINEATQKWLGVLVGGLEAPNTTSYAVAAHYLLEAFQRKNSSATLKAEVLL